MVSWCKGNSFDRCKYHLLYWSESCRGKAEGLLDRVETMVEGMAVFFLLSQRPLLWMPPFEVR